MMKTPSTPVPLAWLHVLIACTFCQSCQCYNGERSRKTNHFCKDCLSAMCQYCALRHKNSEISHSVLQIRRYWYNDVVSVPKIQMHVNVMDIQTYNSNNETVIHIKAKGSSPSSHPGGKSKLLDGSIQCAVCSQIIKLPYRFCSIACKLKQWHRDKQQKPPSNVVSWHSPSVAVVPSGALKIIIKNPYWKKPKGEPSSSAMPSSLPGERTASSHQALPSTPPSGPMKIYSRHGTGPRSKRKGIPVRSPLWRC